jgi:hypothetical protein
MTLRIVRLWIFCMDTYHRIGSRRDKVDILILIYILLRGRFLYPLMTDHTHLEPRATNRLKMARICSSSLICAYTVYISI